jgi:hypothetical protein
MAKQTGYYVGKKFVEHVPAMWGAGISIKTELLMATSVGDHRVSTQYNGM